MTYYQEITLLACFEEFCYPLHIQHDMAGIISPNCKSQDDLLEAIQKGGSLAYNALVETLETVCWEKPHLYNGLHINGIKEWYTWVYLDNSGEILSKSRIIYGDKRTCLTEAAKHFPDFDTYDGAGAPSAKLCIESMCKCYLHVRPKNYRMIKPCECYKKLENSWITNSLDKHIGT
jgi:hypothetical protein